jgi:hypothetical protein
VRGVKRFTQGAVNAAIIGDDFRISGHKRIRDGTPVKV